MGALAKRTHIYEFHKERGKLIEFAGFEHAVWYEGIAAEHMAVREAVGIFDVTHMGRFIVRGPDAAKFLNRLVTRDVEAMNVSQGRYTAFLNDRGGFVDDVTLFKLAEDEFLIVGNAANREKDYSWMLTHSGGYDVEVEDVSDNMPMFAVQGPLALATLNRIADADLSGVKRYWCASATLAGHSVLLTRSGYTGEDGFEIYMPDTPLSESDRALDLWHAVLKAGKEYGIKPCGLGARDTLRIEAGMCLYGADINEETTPLEARLDFILPKGKGDFIGKAALEEQAKSGLTRVRVGVKLLDRGVPRAGSELWAEGQRVGYVTSGTFSPLLKCGIAIGYVRPEFSKAGTALEVVTRGRAFKAAVSEMPFYDTTKYGWRREM